jgi:hypothetical protein
MKRIEAMRQALSCYHLLHARDYCVQALTLLTKMETSELSEEALEQWARTLAEGYKDLEPLDEVEPLARATLASLGLPPTIEEFEDYYGNRCRIKLNMDAVMAHKVTTRKTANSFRVWLFILVSDVDSSDTRSLTGVTSEILPPATRFTSMRISTLEKEGIEVHGHGEKLGKTGGDIALTDKTR